MSKLNAASGVLKYDDYDVWHKGNLPNPGLYPPSYRYTANSGTGILIKFPFLVTATRMASFNINVYKNYEPYMINVSCYLYNYNGGTLHAPKARLVHGSTSLPFKMGLDDDNNVYCWIGGSAAYAGVTITDITAGHSASADAWYSGWDWKISDDGSEITRISISTTLYPPATTDGVVTIPGAQTITGIKTFSDTTYLTRAYLPLSSGYGRMLIDNDRFGFSKTDGTSIGVNIGNLLVSNDWSHRTRVPANGIYSLGSIYCQDIIKLGEGKTLLLRHTNESYYGGIGWDNQGNECLALWAKNPVTRLRWYAGKDLSAGVTANSIMGVTPDFEISKADGTAKGYIGGNLIYTAGNLPSIPSLDGYATQTWCNSTFYKAGSASPRFTAGMTLDAGATTGGWARTLWIGNTPSNGASGVVFGGCGASDTPNYAYIGVGGNRGYDTASNLKVYTNKVTFNNKNLLTESDLSSYVTSSAADAKYAPLTSVISVADGTNYINVSLPSNLSSLESAKKYLEWWDSTPGWYNFRVGYLVANGEVTSNGNVLKSINNGNTVSIGSQNTSYCHFSNSASVPFHFNKDVKVQGNLYMGASYDKLVATQEWCNSQFPTKTGSGASGSWGINITGSAAKIGTTTIGSLSTPVYINAGIPSVITSLTKDLVVSGLNATGTNTITQYTDFTAGAGNSGSDTRFKRDIKPLPSILSLLMNVDVISYTWDKSGERTRHTFGVKAQQLMEMGDVLKSIVHERDDDDKTLFVEYDRVGVLALKGLQEEVLKRDNEIKTLRDELNTLKLEMKAIKDLIRNMI